MCVQFIIPRNQILIMHNLKKKLIVPIQKRKTGCQRRRTQEIPRLRQNVFKENQRAVFAFLALLSAYIDAQLAISNGITFQ